MSASHADLLRRHRAVMPSWVGLYYEAPIALVRGQGCSVTDAEGNEYLDFFGGILTTMLGHNIPEVVDAVCSQARRIMHTSTVYLIEEQISLAERIAQLSGIEDARVFFTASGTEANEAALLLCTCARRSNQVLALRGSYHGRSYGAMGITGNRSWSPSGFSPLVVSYVSSGYRYRSPFGHLPDDEFTQACVDDLRNVIETTTSGDIACMIIEPIQGVGGFTVPPDGFFGAMKAVLEEYSIPLISDEVQTGWGRTGEHFWGIGAHGVVPEAMTFAKGLGNGLSIGGVVATAELMESVGASSISTFGGNPLSTAAANATLDYLVSHDLQRHAFQVGTMLMDGLSALARSHDIVGEVRGKGLMIGVEMVSPGSKDPSAGAASRVMEEARRRGVLVGKGGLYSNVLRISPPLTLSISEAEEGLGALSEAISIVSKEAVA